MFMIKSSLKSLLFGGSRSVYFNLIKPMPFNYCRVLFSTIEKRPEASQILEEVEAVVFQVIKSASKENLEKISRDQSFKDLGFDSLDSVEMVIAMEEYLGVEVVDREANSIETVQDAIAVFHRYVIEKYNRDKLAVKKKFVSQDLVRQKKRDDEEK